LLDERIENDGSSLVREWVLDEKPIGECFSSLLDRGMEERCETVAQICEFVFAEPIRRPEARSLLFAAPGEMLGEAVAAGLGALRDRSAQIAITVLGEPPKRDAGDSEASVVQWVSSHDLGELPHLGELPLFLIYFGEGSAYAMICEDAPERDRTRFFQTRDRNLVEHLTLRLQQELHGSRSDSA
jgi:hypothetical protein